MILYSLFSRLLVGWVSLFSKTLFLRPPSTASCSMSWVEIGLPLGFIFHRSPLICSGQKFQQNFIIGRSIIWDTRHYTLRIPPLYLRRLPLSFRSSFLPFQLASQVSPWGWNFWTPANPQKRLDLYITGRSFLLTLNSSLPAFPASNLFGTWGGVEVKGQITWIIKVLNSRPTEMLFASGATVKAKACNISLLL